MLHVPFSHLKPPGFGRERQGHELGEDPGAEGHAGPQRTSDRSPQPPKNIRASPPSPKNIRASPPPAPLGPSPHRGPARLNISVFGAGMRVYETGTAGSRLIFKLELGERRRPEIIPGAGAGELGGALPESDTVNLQPELEAGPS